MTKLAESVDEVLEILENEDFANFLSTTHTYTNGPTKAVYLEELLQLAHVEPPHLRNSYWKKYLRHINLYFFELFPPFLLASLPSHRATYIHIVQPQQTIILPDSDGCKHNKKGVAEPILDVLLDSISHASIT